MTSLSGTVGDAGDKYTGLDRFGRVVDQRWTKGTTPTSAVVDRSTSTYDRNSNRLTRTNVLAAAFSETYAYDALNQLTSFSRGGGTTTSQQWQFDALGNPTTVTTNAVVQSRTANAQNEVTQVGGSTLGYSSAGNLTTDELGRNLVYDAWNRLVSVRNSANTEIARYEYDGLHRRIIGLVGTPAAPSAAAAPVRDVYYSQDWQVLEERRRTAAGAIPATADTRFIWSPVYVDALIARDRDADGSGTTGTGGLEQRVYALQDANWNTTAIVAAAGVPGVAAGNVINRFVYTPYGESQTLTASWTTPAAGSTPATPWAHLFQGLEQTSMTGLSQARNRQYSPSLGRFIQLDPIGFQAGDNNWYRFVGNAPTGRTDPSGLHRYRLGGKHPGDHSRVCVDMYDSQGNKTGQQYCCSLEAQDGSGGSESFGSGSRGSRRALTHSTWCTDISLGAAMIGLWRHPAAILCGPTALTPKEKANQRVESSRQEDEKLLKSLMQENGSPTTWNGAISNCHQYALSRLYVGLNPACLPRGNRREW